jgi:hypothetical protein
MFRDNPKAMEQVGEALKRINKALYNDTPLSTVWMIPFANELIRHMDENDECHVVVKLSKQHGLQMSYGGCRYHAALLAALMQIRQSKICSELPNIAQFPIREKAAVGLLACEMALILDELIDSKPPASDTKEKPCDDH